MPVIMLVGAASKFVDQLKEHFCRYEAVVMDGPFKAIRSEMSNLEDKLYIVPGLDKPERYEIFCLAKKNEQSFITVAVSTEGLSENDRNKLVIGEFDGKEIEEKLVKQNATASKRTKFISFKINDLKRMINEINKGIEGKQWMIAQRECEEIVMKAYTQNKTETPESMAECYKRLLHSRMV